MKITYLKCKDCNHRNMIGKLICTSCTMGNRFINYEKEPNFQRHFLLKECKEDIEKELQIEKCLELSVKLWNEYKKLPVEHPNQVNEFAAAIHVIQEKLALKIARIYRPDLYPNKMEESTDE